MQELVRLPVPAELQRTFVLGEIPEDLATPQATTLHLVAIEMEALEWLRLVLPEDVRFEHMSAADVEESTARFVCLAHFRREENHVDAFVAEHARALMQLTCFFPVEDLTVASEISAYGVRFIPASTAPLPARFLAPHPQPPMASVVAVDHCRGTNYERMAERAREIALHGLRVLRAVLREDRFVKDQQLRFRLGEVVWFSDSASGWSAAADRAWGYELSKDALKFASPPPVSSLPATGRSDVEQAANRALWWFEQAQLAVDPLIELLFLFFALEALIGDTEREKGRRLAIRRAVLGSKTTGHFTHPRRTYLYYGRVRSTAVHGGEPPKVSRDELNKLGWDIRAAINEFLRFASEHRMTERRWVVQALDRDPIWQQVDERFLKDQ